MTQHFTRYWRNKTWNELKGVADGYLLDHIAGELFTKLGVKVGSIIYVITVLGGELYLCGKLVVGKICTAQEAASCLGQRAEEYWPAPEHIVASEATRMQFDLVVPASMTADLRFIHGRETVPPKFVAPGRLDRQTLRIVRELEVSSALALDSLLPPLQKVNWTTKTT